MSVGSILENYDHDKMFPVFGYGGIPGYSTDRKVSHCFSLNGTPDGAVFGTRGILDAYTAAFQQGLRLYGPTLFAEFLHLFVNQVEQTVQVQPNQYNVFLIITDGAIFDMPETKSWIVEASKLPISIIIIGVGNDQEGFRKM